MPIVRSYMCPECGHYMTVTLPAEAWDDPAPNCPKCVWADEPKFDRMQQDFKPPAIGGSARSQAEKITEDILDKDFQVGNIHRDRHEGHAPKVNYKDQGRPLDRATWGVGHAALEAAVASGRQSRIAHGSGLDILQANLKSGKQPDLIEVSKRRAIRVW